MQHFARTALLGLAASFIISGSSHAAEDIETPDYEVLDTEAAGAAPGDTIELRRYAPMIVAEVTVEAGNRDEASSKGFEPLASYIFGRNAPGGTIAMTAPVTATPDASGEGGGETIAMTAPVTATPEASGEGEGETIAMTAPVTTAATDTGDERYIVRFMMPSSYTMESLPEPLDPDVRLSRLPERTLVALRFVGERSAERVEAAERAINDYIDASGLEPSGPFVTAGYDGPQTPPSEKRWEVQRPVLSAAPVTQ
ncbi:hypothetical protein OG2516_17508 [Oceanicola granulosus HTCC2516]|uniref:SOUL heme-binding protein n=1 Tax=Oceanicola granulosus (strain ATCC BAA-861 / DSM 15982 / KCTC 12143 / HTCC2516) TaxID=314256 RepID=Q2CB82_OCEGH|nr:heme-binding protein [Oceanicola granulosus]EAR49957.1 hypothetical protein OG2516_17508 [Oceanicola granulosus HTCC2516]